jgi:hypothetical protein
VQPGAERAPVVEAPQRGERALEPVGGHVVGKRPASGNCVRSAPGIAPVTAEEVGCGLTVAAACPPYEVSVTRFTHSFAVLYERTTLARPGTGILPA